jgi:hypothetical protein
VEPGEGLAAAMTPEHRNELNALQIQLDWQLRQIDQLSDELQLPISDPGWYNEVLRELNRLELIAEMIEHRIRRIEFRYEGV